MQERIELLAYWIRERRKMLEKRRAGMAPPWTADPILSNYRFTNVRREDDRVTIWISRHWREPMHDHPNLTAAMVLARLVNNPNTLEVIGPPRHWNALAISDAMKFRRAQGLKILNAAYLVTTCGVPGDKVDYIVHLASEVQRSGIAPKHGETLEEFHGALMRFLGLGTFLAGQVVADLKNTTGNPLKTAVDWWAWAAVGPGSIKGLRAALGQADIRERQFLPLATQLYRDVEAVYGEPLEICMQDFQNCLCEFSKYWRAHTGTGVPKQRYDARAV